jgi:hypothetical protein
MKGGAERKKLYYPRGRNTLGKTWAEMSWRERRVIRHIRAKGRDRAAFRRAVLRKNITTLRQRA